MEVTVRTVKEREYGDGERFVRRMVHGDPANSDSVYGQPMGSRDGVMLLIDTGECGLVSDDGTAMRSLVADLAALVETTVVQALREEWGYGAFVRGLRALHEACVPLVATYDGLHGDEVYDLLDWPWQVMRRLGVVLGFDSHHIRAAPRVAGWSEDDILTRAAWAAENFGS